MTAAFVIHIGHVLKYCTPRKIVARAHPADPSRFSHASRSLVHRRQPLSRLALPLGRESLPRPGRQQYSISSRRPTYLQSLLGEATAMDSYRFPDMRLKRKLSDPSKTPLLLVACGSFSPITFLHLRMFVMAADYVKHNTSFELIGGYLSPVSDAYKKQGLASAEHR